MDKTARLFFIIHHLSHHDSTTAKELASLCNTSDRTIYRDIKLLDENGFFIIREGSEGYRMIDKPITNAKLSSDELLAFILFPLLPEKAKTTGHPLYQTYQSAIEKAGAQTTDRNTISLINQLSSRILYQSQQNKQQNYHHMADIIHAISSNQSIFIKYYSIYRDTETERLIDPYYLVPRSGHLYIIGWCHHRRDIRIFRLNRIKTIEKTEKFYTIKQDFDIDQYLKNRWSILAEDDGLVATFKVHFDKDVARYIEEMEHYVETNTEINTDGSLLLTAIVKSKTEFIRWVRQFGSKAEILEPTEVRKELLQEAEELLKMYKE